MATKKPTPTCRRPFRRGRTFSSGGPSTTGKAVTSRKRRGVSSTQAVLDKLARGLPSVEEGGVVAHGVLPDLYRLGPDRLRPPCPSGNSCRGITFSADAIASAEGHECECHFAASITVFRLYIRLQNRFLSRKMSSQVVPNIRGGIQDLPGLERRSTRGRERETVRSLNPIVARWCLTVIVCPCELPRCREAGRAHSAGAVSPSRNTKYGLLNDRLGHSCSKRAGATLFETSGRDHFWSQRESEHDRRRRRVGVGASASTPGPLSARGPGVLYRLPALQLSP